MTKTHIVAVLSLAFTLRLTFAGEPSVIVKKTYLSVDKGEALLKVILLDTGSGSGTIIDKVHVINVLKNNSDFDFPDTISICRKSSDEGPSKTHSKIVLVRQNSDDGSWQLVRVDPVDH